MLKKWLVRLVVKDKNEGYIVENAELYTPADVQRPNIKGLIDFSLGEYIIADNENK